MFRRFLKSVLIIWTYLMQDVKIGNIIEWKEAEKRWLKKSTKEKKTNDERILDQHHIEYEEVSFDWINNGADALAEAKGTGSSGRKHLENDRDAGK